MSNQPLSAELLRKIPIFKNMNDSERRQLAEVASVMQFRERDLVLEQGKSSQNLWIVLEGRCEVFQRADAALPGGKTSTGEVRLAALEPFSNFGEMSFFQAAPHSANVRAVTPLKLLRIARGDYNDLVNDGASAAYKLACNAIESLAERLRRMDEWCADLMRTGQVAAAATQAVASEAAAAVGQPAPHIPEWDRFRDKLFTGWNL